MKKMYPPLRWLRMGKSRGVAIASVIEIVIGAILISAIIPVAMQAISGANQTGWGTAEIALWGTLGIFIVLACLMVLIRPILDKLNG